MLAGLNIGLVKEVARYFFNLKVDMIRIATQDVDGSQFTSWRIVVRGPYEEAGEAGSSSRSLSEDSYKSGRKEQVVGEGNTSESGAKVAKCPFGY